MKKIEKTNSLFDIDLFLEKHFKNIKKEKKKQDKLLVEYLISRRLI